MRYWYEFSFFVTGRLTPALIAPVLALTGYRFDKTWRLAEHGPKALFYSCCCTFLANNRADVIAYRFKRLGERERQS